MSDVILERHGRVAHVVLNRPDKLNALHSTALDELDHCCIELENDTAIGAVVVRGAGRAFCAGADLREVERSLGREDEFLRFLERWHAVVGRLAALPIATVAAVHGPALAGGFEIVQACDVVICSTEARIADQHARFGVFPGGGSTQRLIRQIPQRHARWLLMTGEAIDLQLAVTWGIANAVVEPHLLTDEVQRHVDILLRRSPTLTAQIKHAIALGAELDLAEALRLERELSDAYMHGDDAGIGMRALRERSEPSYPPRRDLRG